MEFKSKKYQCYKQMQSTRTTQQWVWRPAIFPSWEKEFCLKNSSFKSWKNFLRYKENTRFYYEILNWDDSAGEKAFYDAKNKFYAEFRNLHFDNLELSNPDLYIDEIDWNPKIDSNLLEELEFALLMKKKGTNLVQVRTLIEEIVPSGWDVDDDVYKNGLTGLIVGDHSKSGEGVKVSPHDRQRRS
ncbi:hypothetical protein KY284_008229 [Solanum tuberosum]|nr:hypothetical protein KY284_008229 [Solanum tuberosum]